MGKIVIMALIFVVVLLTGCSNVQKNDKKQGEIKKAPSVEKSPTKVEKEIPIGKYQFLKPKKSEGMVAVMTKEKVSKEKDFGQCFNEGVELGAKEGKSGDVIMVIMDYKEGGGQTLMCEYDLYVSFKNKEISIDEYMDGIVVKDMNDEEMKKSRDVF